MEATTAMGFALAVALMAAVCDLLWGTIPNWLTLPSIMLAPLVYGLSLGPEHLLRSFVAAFLSSLVPYLLFRRGAMGGGDVKLFGALGAVTGFDPWMGLEISLAALIVALVTACSALAWKGTLLTVLGRASLQALYPLMPTRWRRSRSEDLSAPIRLGGAVMVATGILAAPYLWAAWGRL